MPSIVSPRRSPSRRVDDAEEDGRSYEGSEAGCRRSWWCSRPSPVPHHVLPERGGERCREAGRRGARVEDSLRLPRPHVALRPGPRGSRASVMPPADIPTAAELRAVYSEEQPFGGLLIWRARLADRAAYADAIRDADPAEAEVMRSLLRSMPPTPTTASTMGGPTTPSSSSLPGRCATRAARSKPGTGFLPSVTRRSVSRAGTATWPLPSRPVPGTSTPSTFRM